MAETCLRIHAQVIGRGNYRVEDHPINVHAMLDNNSQLQRNSTLFKHFLHVELAI